MGLREIALATDTPEMVREAFGHDTSDADYKARYRCQCDRMTAVARMIGTRRTRQDGDTPKPLVHITFPTMLNPVKKIGFLSFGHWADSYGSQVRSAADALVQSIELAVVAEELGADGASVEST